MTRRIRHRLLFLAAAGVFASAAPAAFAQAVTESLEPYQMLRSLQFVQDTVVMGDHSAGEMQRFMLSELDRKFRVADPRVFDDPRNVDAALIYAMSGGNPATLELLVSKDVSGNFDNRVADVLRKYLNGRGLLVANTLAAMTPEYRSQRVGPYLALVAGNVMVAKEPKRALEFYDWARLMAPGTIVEEAALRRSIAIAIDVKMPDKAFLFARQYARRFIHSPYASQFADLFVGLVVKHYGEISREDIEGALDIMDDDRAREIYLRIARQATINGKGELAQLAADRARQRGGDPGAASGNVAKLYSGVASLSQGDVADALKVMGDVPSDQLSPEDRALRAAAQQVAEEVMRPPSAAPDQAVQGQDSLEQDKRSSLPNQISAEETSAVKGNETTGSKAGVVPASDSANKLDPAFTTFVEKSRSNLSAVDDLLREEK
ncbi:chemotaxis protein MotC [Rhizobium sp. SAFR-030]|uniref:chemotaxis protein MotC n=1 Tax=Rhizobium sp. SAFR-030 TaxID=3387277 RepID=UPI003F7FF17F